MKATSRIERDAFERGRKQGTKEAIVCAIAAVALAVADSGLCRNTVERIITKSFKTFHSITEGRLDFLDVLTTLKDDYEITIEL